MFDDDYLLETEDGVLLRIVVKPNSRKREVILDELGNYIVVAVKSPPTKGKANKELIKVLADFFNLSKSSLLLTAGHTSGDKTILIINHSVNKIRKRLKESR
jgi:hypothetical protein